MDLQELSIAEPAKKLAQREAAEQFIVEPYQAYKITIGENETDDTGTTAIVRIWD